MKQFICIYGKIRELVISYCSNTYVEKEGIMLNVVQKPTDVVLSRIELILIRGHQSLMRRLGLVI